MWLSEASVAEMGSLWEEIHAQRYDHLVMESIERLRREEAQVRAREAEQERLYETALAAGRALDRSHLLRLSVRLIDLLRAQETQALQVSTGSDAAEVEPKTKSEAAERLVLSEPGLTALDVGARIGQPTNVADSTLRYVSKSRRTIARRDDGTWHPTGSESPRKTTLRDAISTVLDGEKALGTSTIYARVVAVAPKAEKASVASEIARMRRDGLLLTFGGGRGAKYSLLSGAGSSSPGAPTCFLCLTQADG
jgi:hypothetical protein